VLHLIDDAFHVLDSSLDIVQRLLENVPFCATGTNTREQRRRRRRVGGCSGGVIARIGGGRRGERS
jgi:hypothetical protein